MQKKFFVDRKIRRRRISYCVEQKELKKKKDRKEVSMSKRSENKGWVGKEKNNNCEII